MASYCFKPFKVPRVRATLLDACGLPATGDSEACASVTTDGIITIEQTAELQDMDDFYEKNADGNFCVEEVDPEILKWYNLTLTFCLVDPELVYLLTRSALVMSDADTPVAIGNDSSEGDIALVNFSFEAWTRLANQADCTEGAKFGYALWPWMVQGKMGDVTYQNGTANFVVTARTHRDSPWGVGPYTVVKSEATATLDNPKPLLTPIPAILHRRFFVTGLNPPVSSCGCTSVPLPLDAPVIAGQQVTFTLPAATIPAYIDWGDGSTTSNAAGPTAQHTYSGAGTRTVRIWPQGTSSAPYQRSVTT